MIISTDTLPQKARMKLLTWTAMCYPEEACGVICGTRSNPLPFRLPNVSDDAERTFRVDPEELAAVVEAYGMPFAVWHSHPRGNRRPSQEDLQFHPQGWAMFIVTLEEVLEVSGW